MNRRTIIAVSAIAAFGLGLLPGSAFSQQKSLKEQLVGTWTFVSALDVHPDGSKTDRWGPQSEGRFHVRRYRPFFTIHYALRPS